MYNSEYDDLSFEEQLHLTESLIRRRHNQQIFLRRNAQLLQQELSFEAELLEDNPEFAQTIYAFNMQEIQINQQGLQNVLGSEESPSKEQSVWSKFFPGLCGR
ncbi:hypothetical protein [Nostoc sp. ATCC 53789]|uniref:hypothetical protein n=1 Tax=Nostoc sp. ATCC 53789 TaxID=76335 RepID=UPI000DEC8C32|nr:hypothetical protein [Nostoc sp. ATCC 53789]QHG20332.1 hypothetical protein GJB62_30870 [Nostoc sp. ATCC 53789]QHG20827.1 hypothetical protein GJB62_33650 [Nostoc sp. ATCC 53789]RCJ32362.1 hypothetical protein A6V25_35150 [Nostoc sp. ATCC 53789]